MNAYVYRAALYCESCTAEIKDTLRLQDREPADPSDEYSYDSDDWPKGPYPDGGGEADTPQHCDSCGVFLENPLTADGIEYVLDLLAENRCPPEWREFYAYALEQ